MGAILTPEWLRKSFLTSIKLVDEDGNRFPKEHFDQAILEAISWVKTAIDVVIPEQDFTDERHDFTDVQWAEYAWVQLDKRPIKDKPRMTLKLGNGEILVVPEEWVHLMLPDAGQVQLVPTAGKTSSWPLQALGFLGVYSFSRLKDIPGFYSMDYKAGFKVYGEDKDFDHEIVGTVGRWVPRINIKGQVTITLGSAQAKDVVVTIRGYDLDNGDLLGGNPGRGSLDPEIITIPAGQLTAVTETYWSSITLCTFTNVSSGNISFSGIEVDESDNDIPYDILGLIGRRAAINILNAADVTILGAGIASRNSSLDSTSVSVGTTASPSSTVFGSRIRNLEKEIESMIPVIRRRYHGFSVKVG